MLAKLKKSPSLSRILKALSNGESLLLEGLEDCQKATLLAAIDKPILFITANERDTKVCEDLLFFEKTPRTLPAWETLPGEDIAPSPDIVGRRFEVLAEYSEEILIAPIQSLLQKVVPKATLQAHSLTLQCGDEVLFEKLPERLTELGYTRQTVASDKGEFAVRGGIIDIFPLASFEPVRLDFFGDTLDEMRSFDPISQKSVGSINRIFIPPANERALLKKASTTLFSYLSAHCLIIFDDLLRLEDSVVSLESLPTARSPLLTPFRELVAESLKRTCLFFTNSSIKQLSETATNDAFDMFDRRIHAHRMPHEFFPIVADEELNDFSELHCIAETDSEQRSMRQKLAIPDSAHFHKGSLSSGFILRDLDLAVYPYSELSGKHKMRRQKWRTTYQTPSADFHELKPGDLVVHFHNGIGKFLGIDKRTNNLGNEEEFMIIEYAQGGKLFAPLSQSHLISRYIGASDESPPLHKLGTQTWQKQKVRTQKAIVGYAQDLIKYQALREVHGGISYPDDSDDMRAFEEDFPFVETADQLNAIAEVKKDMCEPIPMDRLICGDVGYGKTEVAMRAAFKAVADGNKQVAVLVPTTVLAMQHYDTFQERMANYPIRIGVLSRFVKTKARNKTLEEVAQGSVDILIGTHRIISKDISFKNLGLIIIDEEQRFGVRAKEHLRKAKIGVDCLTLSATPIPRTLYFSLIGARPMSVINTPPQDRLPIKTIIAERNHDVIKNAILRELTHNGQAYFIHNRVETITTIASDIEKMLPSATVSIVHGQMKPDAIDAAFHAFKSGEIDVLCATTIVESGVDIPNANTMLIDRAHHYGLADLYQLRGRVGRWNKPAYAYFLIPANKELPEIARKRLNALIDASGFGGGMKLAMRDLEIRGAGDILGTQQSGNVATIGFHFYCKLLKRAIDTLKKNLQPDFTDVKIEHKYPAQIPERYIPETALRIEFYHRLGDALAFEEVDALFAEMKDRFGTPPTEVEWLYHLTRLRVYAAQAKISALKFGQKFLTVEKTLRKKQESVTLFLATYTTPKAFEEGVTRLLQRLP